MNKTQAIKETTQEYTKLYRFGNQWRYNWFDVKVNAWRESMLHDYWNAGSNRKVDMIRTAKMKLCVEDDHYLEPGDYQGQSWQYWV